MIFLLRFDSRLSRAYRKRKYRLALSALRPFRYITVMHLPSFATLPRFLARFAFLLVPLLVAPALPARNEPAPPASESASSSTPSAAVSSPDPNTTAAAAAVASGEAKVETPGFVTDATNSLLEALDVKTSGNTTTRYIIAGSVLVVFYLLKRLVAYWLFALFHRLAARTRSTLDDKLAAAVEQPVGAFVLLAGFFIAVNVLKLPASTALIKAYAATIAFSLCFFWLLIRALGTVLDHLHEIALRRQAGVAAFMPWIKKTLIAAFVILAVLMIAQNLGANVSAFLAGLGIGGLAFALAAQDTIANLFGSVVVAIDQPFKIGEAIKIGNNSGVVEDIGLRSTRLRLPDRSLAIIPNKTVAAETIVNQSRFIQRRVDMVVSLTYDTTPEQIEAIVRDIAAILEAEKEEVLPGGQQAWFRDLSASSLDIAVGYTTRSPDFNRFMVLRQRINLAIMRAVAARGLSFAYPTQTLQFDGPLAKQWAAGRSDAK
ncbi:small mechanosensitive ion channel protein MscS [Opitutaceae bacterium TAV5]|nr:small mechanosensitive ion channel protein MscS [Opitutaceae bacterium TAV5]